MLTREEILAMSAGRELDDLIEFKVMGTSRPAKGFVINPKHYSESISAAWEMESTIPEEKRRLYAMMLTNIAGTGFDLAHASPLDRCKAALLTTIQGEET